MYTFYLVVLVGLREGFCKHALPLAKLTTLTQVSDVFRTHFRIVAWGLCRF